ncbi:MAG: MerR family transcriptional regulator [Ruminococcaceae bacterium]|nr:MerR family transcriptional regulator [Oscillospiraceae bacterium]
MNSENLFSIGEIAKAIGITRKTILNYETKGLIKPDRKDGTMGNRYYTIDTFTQIRTIRVFQGLGLSLDEVREYLDDTTDLQPMIQRLEKMKNQLILTIEKLKERTYKQGDSVKKITIAPQTIYCRTYNSVSVSDKTILLRDTALEAMRKYGTDTTRRMYFTEYSETSPTEISYCVAVPAESEGEYIKHLPLLEAISFFHHGAYEEIPDARKKLLQYATENHITLSGVFRNLYLEGPPQHKDKSKFITQIVAFIK